jgi:Holliday junction DNA helicase RuvB
MWVELSIKRLKGVNLELIGHENTKRRIGVAVKSAIIRNKALPHILLSGAAGCGKTTTARWLATLGGYDFTPVTPLSLKTVKDVYTLLEKMNHSGYNNTGDRIGKITPTILFFDEIHQMPVIAQEILGVAMERFLLDSDKSKSYIWLPYFTIVGATTDDGILTKPFRDRLKMKFIFEPYSDEEMEEIVKFHAIQQKLIITEGAVTGITQRSRGVPRIMVNNLEVVRDVMLSNGAKVISSKLVDFAFNSIDVDPTGLTKVEVKILKSLYETSGPIGLDNLAIITNESPKTISQSLEPFLIRRGLLLRQAKGRAITEKGKEYLETMGHITSKNTDKSYIDVSHVRM